MLQKQLLYLFQNRKVEQELEYSYEIYENTNVEIAVPDGYQVEPVTKQTLHKGYENEVILIHRLEECWNSLEDFFEKSLSFIAVKDQKIVGIIFGSGRYEKYIPIDIEVLEELNILVRQSRLSSFIRATVPVIGSHQKCYAAKGSLHE